MEKRESKRFLVTALGEEVRRKWTRVDCGCCVYVYIYMCVRLEQEKRTDSPWEVDNLFPRSNNRHFRSERKGIESLSELNPVTG